MTVDDEGQATVLLVEDNEMNRDMLSRRLRRKGYRVLVAEDGESGVAMVRSELPDLVLMEFASNDADLRDGVGRSQARRQTAEVVAALQAAGPDAPAIALVTMGPAAGLRGVLRPRLAGHYAGYRALAEAQSLGLVDLEARWRALGRGERGMDDGLHPDPATARAVIVPALAQWLGC